MLNSSNAVRLAHRDEGERRRAVVVGGQGLRPAAQKGHGKDLPAAGAGGAHSEDAVGVEAAHSGQIVAPETEGIVFVVLHKWSLFSLPSPQNFDLEAHSRVVDVRLRGPFAVARLAAQPVRDSARDADLHGRNAGRAADEHLQER